MRQGQQLASTPQAGLCALFTRRPRSCADQSSGPCLWSVCQRLAGRRVRQEVCFSFRRRCLGLFTCCWAFSSQRAGTVSRFTSVAISLQEAGRYPAYKEMVAEYRWLNKCKCLQSCGVWLRQPGTSRTLMVHVFFLSGQRHTQTLLPGLRLLLLGLVSVLRDPCQLSQRPVTGHVPPQPAICF